ncbi:MAG: imidazole glycerol phosphate synthase subunit HisH [Oscillospiraceae bacterium]|nr:imidazole glycerol phosphate synthase subunit HisH [Oscillospiraceae bacterium]
MGLRKIGESAEITADPGKIRSAERLILPGVGAFEGAINKLRESGLADLIKEETENGKPLLGICLGMQLLFDKSYEYGVHKGLGLIPGKVVPLKGYVDENLKIPHIGWNSLEITMPECSIFKYNEQGDHVYFVHSYYATECESDTAAVTEYSKTVTATVWKDNVYGCQFHPEKSGEKGLKILKAFCELS